MKFRIVLEFDPEVQSYSAISPELPGCASAGETEEEARGNIEEAIRLYLPRRKFHLRQRQARRDRDWVIGARRG